MKANELRVGNYYSQNPFFIIERSDHFGPDKRVDFNEEIFKLDKERLVNILDKNYLDCITPVTLTEEWLSKLGLEYDEIEKEIFLEKYTLYLRKNKELNVFDVYEGVNDSFLLSVEYVHQLQNLYFTLTGKELTC